jgi:hypothetical protein
LYCFKKIYGHEDGIEWKGIAHKFRAYLNR